VNSEPHVLVDATAIPANRGGVGRNLEFLVPALDRIGARMTVVAQPRDVDWLRAVAPNAEVISPASLPSSRPLRLAWEQVALPRIARRVGADVIFSPHYTMPLAAHVPVVVALYDAIFFSHPELHSRLKRIFFRFWIRRSLGRAAACVAPSEATRSELLRLLQPRHDRIRVALLGVDQATFHRPTAAEAQSAAELIGTDKWIAFLGTLEPRKNVANLVRAFGIVAVHDAVARRFPRLVLALAGGRGWDQELDGVISESPVRDRVIRLGFVPDEVLAGVLGSSLATAYPSYGEGFGFPVLEAMACGSPIVTTRYLSLPEVGGDVAVYTDTDPESIASGLIELLTDDSERVSRGERGIARAAGFTWADSARAHLDVFASAARSTKRMA
jgi:glycosyltransferase involved in cell wall biosynthesis